MIVSKHSLETATTTGMRTGLDVDVEDNAVGFMVLEVEEVEDTEEVDVVTEPLVLL